MPLQDEARKEEAATTRGQASEDTALMVSKHILCTAKFGEIKL